MDLNGVETIHVNALGGADKITVGDLTGTGVSQVAIDLAGTAGSGAGDGQVDQVTVNATNGNNRITISSAGTSVTVSGLTELVTIDGTEATDQLVINALSGNDTIDASALAATSISLVLDGGAGNDTIIGGAGQRHAVRRRRQRHRHRASG